MPPPPPQQQQQPPVPPYAYQYPPAWLQARVGGGSARGRAPWFCLEFRGKDQPLTPRGAARAQQPVPYYHAGNGGGGGGLGGGGVWPTNEDAAAALAAASLAAGEFGYVAQAVPYGYGGAYPTPLSPGSAFSPDSG